MILKPFFFLSPVMRVLGIPSRVVTVFNAAHDGNGNMIIEEFYTRTGEKFGVSKDSIWLVSLALNHKYTISFCNFLQSALGDFFNSYRCSLSVNSKI